MTDPTRIPTPWNIPAEWLRSWRAERRARAASTVTRTPRRLAPVVDLAELRRLRAAVDAHDLDSPAGAGESVEAFRG